MNVIGNNPKLVRSLGEEYGLVNDAKKRFSGTLGNVEKLLVAKSQAYDVHSHNLPQLKNRIRDIEIEAHEALERLQPKDAFGIKDYQKGVKRLYKQTEAKVAVLLTEVDRLAIRQETRAILAKIGAPTGEAAAKSIDKLEQGSRMYAVYVYVADKVASVAEHVFGVHPSKRPLAVKVAAAYRQAQANLQAKAMAPLSDDLSQATMFKDRIDAFKAHRIQALAVPKTGGAK
jgi:hypothetical protein